MVVEGYISPGTFHAEVKSKGFQNVFTVVMGSWVRCFFLQHLHLLKDLKFSLLQLLLLLHLRVLMLTSLFIKVFPWYNAEKALDKIQLIPNKSTSENRNWWIFLTWKSTYLSPKAASYLIGKILETFPLRTRIISTTMQYCTRGTKQCD